MWTCSKRAALTDLSEKKMGAVFLRALNISFLALFSPHEPHGIREISFSAATISSNSSVGRSASVVVGMVDRRASLGGRDLVSVSAVSQVDRKQWKIAAQLKWRNNERAMLEVPLANDFNYYNKQSHRPPATRMKYVRLVGTTGEGKFPRLKVTNLRMRFGRRDVDLMLYIALATYITQEVTFHSVSKNDICSQILASTARSNVHSTLSFARS